MLIKRRHVEWPAYSLRRRAWVRQAAKKQTKRETAEQYQARFERKIEKFTHEKE